MKNSLYLMVFLAFITSMVFTSCGPSKKLVEPWAKVDKLQIDSAKTHSLLDNCNDLTKTLNDDKALLQAKNKSERMVIKMYFI